jgi:uncharacterized protein YjbI with pentapeptide repeats
VLFGANLHRVKLKGAELKGVDLSWAVLKGETAIDAMSQGANLGGTNLENNPTANFAWRALQRSIGQDPDDLK